jgi:pyruvate,orthophosphate dikinase
MYSNVVLGADHHDYEHALEALKERKGYASDTDMTAEDLKELIAEYKEIGKKSGKVVPQDPKEQLWGGIGAVFDSWDVPRAIKYRNLNNIAHNWGTAVNVQVMVFGNAGNDCATGVCFSRDPSTGENQFYGEYLENAQGEDVVAGIRTPHQMSLAGKAKNKSELVCMEEAMPELYKELCDIREKLELHYRDMQDMEFTIEHGKLWMLQTRNGKRTAAAALKIAVDMVAEDLIDETVAVSRIEPAQLDFLLHPTLDPKASREVIATGLPASPGAAVGKIVFNAEDAEAWVAKGEKVVLVRVETSPEDIGGMDAAEGVLTARGGMTSHAAVVARGMGTPCVSGVGDIKIDYASKSFTTKDGVTVKEGDFITLDGTAGEVIKGALPTVEPELTGDFGKLMTWVDGIRELKVRTNAETPKDAAQARKFGAEGIGLCRTEHMFFDADRIMDMRSMILAEDVEGRKAALAKLLPYQKQDFVDLFKIMEGLPVTIRFLDPPLHEFLPHTEKDMADVAKACGVSLEFVKQRGQELHEFNPMLGHRGCRLGVTYPEVYAMQARAVFEAAVEVTKEGGDPIVPEIMIPLVGKKQELDLMKAVVVETAEAVFAETGTTLDYTVGTMIELPRAALTADEIAETAEFFSFGTNDLTQTTLGMSRDDAGNFLPEYKSKGIYEQDPFASIDVNGVGELVRIAAEKGKATRPGIKLGICGEHGGDAASVEFCHQVGLSYVSCSPFRVPIARLAAAQAVIKYGKKQGCGSCCCCG